MAPVYSVRLASVVGHTPGLVVLWTAPAGYTDILRELIWTAYGAGAGTAALYDAHTGGLLDVINTPAALTTYVRSYRLVVPAATALEINTTSGTWDFCASGYRLAA